MSVQPVSSPADQLQRAAEVLSKNWILALPTAIASLILGIVMVVAVISVVTAAVVVALAATAATASRKIQTQDITQRRASTGPSCGLRWTTGWRNWGH